MLLSQDVGIAGGGGHRSNDTPGYDSSTTDSSMPESIPVHPLGVKPLGNQYFAPGPSARASLGHVLGRLPDEMILRLVECFDSQSLLKLGATCRFLYALCHLDELWKAIFLEAHDADPNSGLPLWMGSWRSTCLQLPPHALATIHCNSVFSDVIHRPFACSNIVLRNYVTAIPPSNRIPRLESLTHDEFAKNWDETPFILTDYVQQWPVSKEWNIESLKRHYAQVKFRAEAVDWPFSAYYSYMCNNDDESPLYLFDRKFAEKMDLRGLPSEQAAYWPPECFGDDLFHLLGSERPAYRWLIIGPERSGSTFHKDPNGTSAWNAVLQGSKYWLMFPPSVAQPPGVFVSDDSSEVTSPLSIAEYLLTFHAEARMQAGCLEGICHAGELLFVPSGWWHLVVNLEEGIALTQNFVTNSRKHLAHVLSFLKNKPDQVSGFSRAIESPYKLFVDRLREEHPGLLDEAVREMERRSGGKKRTWEEAVGAKSDDGDARGGFSFGFSFGGDDDEVIP